MRMVVTNDGKVKHQFPHTMFRVTDNTRLPRPTETAKELGTLVIPFISPKGIDREYLTFDPGQIDRVKDIFGKPNIRSQGFSYAAIHKTLRAGGKVVGMRLTPDNASYSNVALRLTSDISEVPVFYITDDGELYDKEVEQSQPMYARSLKFTYGQSFASGVKDIEILEAIENGTDDLNVIAAGDDIDTNGLERTESHTLYTFLAGGRGRYGDAFKLLLKPTAYIESGKRLFELEVIDTSNSLTLESRQVTHHSELTVDEIAMSIPGSISYYSDHIKIHHDENKSFALGDRVKSVLELTLKDIEEVYKNGVYQGVSLSPISIVKLGDLVDSIKKRIAKMEDNEAQPSQDFIEIFIPEKTIFGRIYQYGDMPAFRFGGGSNGDLDQMKQFGWNFKPTIKNIEILPALPEIYEFIDLGKLGVSIDGNQVEDTSVVWRSSNPDIKVSNDGQLMNVRNESGIRAIITIQTIDGNHRAYKEVLTVTDGAARAVKDEMAKFNTRNDEDEENSGPAIGVPEQLYMNYFNGVYGTQLYNVELVKGDIILDLNYPNRVKEAAAKLIDERRIDMGLIVNAPINANTIEDIVRWVKDFDPENPRMMKVLESGDAFDVESKKYMRMPTTFVMIDDIITWMNLGYTTPLAGETVMVNEFQRGTSRPAVSEDEHFEYLAEHNINYLTLTKLGYMLDGQATNIKNGVYSRMKEFHNIVILGRIMKKMSAALQMKRHLLNVPGVMIGQIQKEINEELEEFRGKVGGLEYSAGFKSDYEEKIGLVDHYINIMPYGSTKFHRVNINVLFQNSGN
ncbi:MAG: Ig-like domain-containing protein [Fusobacteriaceae bacterium]